MRVAIIGVALAVAAGVALIAFSASEDRGEPRDAPAPPIAALASRPDLRPPPVSLDTPAARPRPALILLTPRLENAKRDADTHQQGALAIDEQGRTRWWHPAPDGEPITDLRVQRYRGRPVLTWWQGAASMFGIGRGQAVIADERYRIIATVQAGNGQTADLHEFLLTPRGTALLCIYSRARVDGKLVTQGIVQEVDVESGKVLFEWKSLDHVGLEESFKPDPVPGLGSVDYFHINSVAEDADGDLLVSARHTSTIYKIDKDTGEIVWRLGGKRSDFDLSPKARFGFQHDARWIDDDTLQLFDNRSEPGRSAVKQLRIDERRRRATLVATFQQPDGMWSESQGSADALSDGGVLAGWGSTGAFSRFSADGRVELDGHLPAYYDTYRARQGRWVGRPATRPAIRARREKEQVSVAVSWNGSTEVVAWQVLAGPDEGTLLPVGAPADWDGLETYIVRQTPARYVAVAALDAGGHELARSAAARIPAPPPRP